jgi:hypothetical protein
MKCHNKKCNKEFEQPERADSKRYLYCSQACFLEQRKEFIWANTASERHEQKGKQHKLHYRSMESCEQDPILPIETAYVNYCIRCLPNAPTYDFEDWYDLHLTFGPIDW